MIENGGFLVRKFAISKNNLLQSGVSKYKKCQCSKKLQYLNCIAVYVKCKSLKRFPNLLQKKRHFHQQQ